METGQWGREMSAVGPGAGAVLHPNDFALRSFLLKEMLGRTVGNLLPEYVLRSGSKGTQRNWLWWTQRRGHQILFWGGQISSYDTFNR